VLDGVVWSTPLYGRYPREWPCVQCAGGWVGPRAGLDGCRISRPPPKFDPRTVQPVASRHTDCTVLAHQKECRCRMSQCSLLVPTPVLFVPDSFWTQCLANIYIFKYSGAGVPQWVSGWNIDFRLGTEWRDFSFPKRPDRLFGPPNVPSRAYRGCSGRSFKLTFIITWCRC